MPKSALSIVQEYFPEVNEVQDGRSEIIVEVTKSDNNSATVKNHKACAMAVACKRMTHADGVIVSINTAYVIKGKKAVRFEVPEAVSREIVSFDRQAGFSPGEYKLKPPKPSKQLGVHTGGRNTKKNTKQIKRRHITSGIRTILGSKK